MYSEFGRRVKANASQGTDHGTAGPVFVAGQQVRGGYYGDQPSLTDLDNGDLKVTTDFRAVYAELLDKVLGADPQQILGSAPGGELGFRSAWLPSEPVSYRCALVPGFLADAAEARPGRPSARRGRRPTGRCPVE